MSWESLPQEIFISIWERCDAVRQRSLTRVSKIWFSFVANRLRSPNGPLAKWNTGYLPETGFSHEQIGDNFELVRVYFHLYDVHDNMCYLMDKVIETGHGMEDILKFVGMTRRAYTVAVLVGLHNRFRPDMGEFHGSEMEGRIVYYEDDYYAHLKSRMTHTGRIYIASTLLEGLRYKKLYEALVETKESTGAIDIGKVVLRFSLVDPDYFQLMMCRRRVLDRVANKYADTVDDSMPIETKILNVSLYLQRFSAQESSIVSRVVLKTAKRGLLSRYYGGDIPTPPLFIFTCALCEALKACGFKCYILEWERLLVLDKDNFYSCMIGEELVIRQIPRDDGDILVLDEYYQNGYNSDDDDDQERLLQRSLEHFGLKTSCEVLKMVQDGISDVFEGKYYNMSEGTETELLDGRRIIFPRARPCGDYNLCARSGVHRWNLIGPLIFMDRLVNLLTHKRDFNRAERSDVINGNSPKAAKALIVRGTHPGLRFLKSRIRLGLLKPCSELFFPKLRYGEEDGYLAGIKDGTVFSGGEVLLHTSSIYSGATFFLEELNGGLSYLSPPSTDDKILLSSAEPDRMGQFFSHFDWKEKRWVHNRLFQIRCKEYDNEVRRLLDILESESDWDPTTSPGGFSAKFRSSSEVILVQYGTSSRLDTGSDGALSDEE